MAIGPQQGRNSAVLGRGTGQINVPAQAFQVSLPGGLVEVEHLDNPTRGAVSQHLFSQLDLDQPAPIIPVQQTVDFGLEIRTGALAASAFGGRPGQFIEGLPQWRQALLALAQESLA